MLRHCSSRSARSQSRSFFAQSPVGATNQQCARWLGEALARARNLLPVAPRQIIIDWDWGATGIWTVLTPEEMAAPAPPGRWVAAAPPSDRHRTWRGRVSDELIDALQTWNDRGEEVMGINGHRHTDEERVEFWARGRELAAQAQEQLGADYEVVCRTPKAYLR